MGQSWHVVPPPDVIERLTAALVYRSNFSGFTPPTKLHCRAHLPSTLLIHKMNVWGYPVFQTIPVPHTPAFNYSATIINTLRL